MALTLLHTADWHLGGRFHDQARGEEEDFALEALLEICRRREVDALLVAGDVFDSANPGADAERRYYRFLSRAVHQAGVATVVVIAGNHDSPRRLEGPRELLAGLGIHVVGRLGRDEPPDRALVPLRNRGGRVGATCAALPYLRDGDLRSASLGESQAEAHRRHQKALADRFAEVRGAAGTSGLPVVVMGHCFAASARLGGEERPIQVGNLAQVDAAALAGDAAYLALGHIHRPQRLGGRDRWRYPGSLLPMSFAETGSEAQALLVTMGSPAENGPDEEIRVEALPQPRFRDYRRLAGDPEELLAEIDGLPRPEGDAPTPWCEAAVRLDGPRPGLAQELVDRARERGWALLSVRREVPDHAPDEEAPELPSGLQELTPEEVFARRHRQEYGTSPDTELAAEFLRLLQEVTEGAGA